MNLLALQKVDWLVSNFWGENKQDYLESMGIHYDASIGFLDFLKKLNASGDEETIVKIINMIFMDTAFRRCYDSGWNIFFVRVDVVADDLMKLLAQEGYKVEGFEIRLEEKEPREKVYGKGQVYDFYADIREITKNVRNEVAIMDAYPDEDLLVLYLEKIPVRVKVKILTNKPKGNFITVAQKFKAKPNADFEVRRSDDCHDRMFFVDSSCWVIGQSIKDAAKKPTYLVKIEAFDRFKKMFDDIWAKATILI